MRNLHDLDPVTARPQQSSPDYAREIATWTGRASGDHDGVPAATIPAQYVPDGGLRAFPRGTLSQPNGKRYGQQTELLVIADTRHRVHDLVLGSTAEPQLVIRLGWAPTNAGALPAAPRRDVDEMIERPVDSGW